MLPHRKVKIMSEPICFKGDEIMIVRCFVESSPLGLTFFTHYLEKVKCTIKQFANKEHLTATEKAFDVIKGRDRGCAVGHEHFAFDEYSKHGSEIVNSFAWDDITIDLTKE